MPQLTVLADTVFKRTTAQQLQLPSMDKVAVCRGETLEIVSAYRVGDHYLVKLPQSLEPVGQVGYFYCPRVAVVAEEIRGVWLTHTDSEVLHSREATQQHSST